MGVIVKALRVGALSSLGAGIMLCEAAKKADAIDNVVVKEMERSAPAELKELNVLDTELRNKELETVLSGLGLLIVGSLGAAGAAILSRTDISGDVFGLPGIGKKGRDADSQSALDRALERINRERGGPSPR